MKTENGNVKAESEQQNRKQKIEIRNQDDTQRHEAAGEPF
jgi:hypothetical protein